MDINNVVEVSTIDEVVESAEVKSEEAKTNEKGVEFKFFKNYIGGVMIRKLFGISLNDRFFYIIKDYLFNNIPAIAEIIIECLSRNSYFFANFRNRHIGLFF